LGGCFVRSFCQVVLGGRFVRSFCQVVLGGGFVRSFWGSFWEVVLSGRFGGRFGRPFCQVVLGGGFGLFFYPGRPGNNLGHVRLLPIIILVEITSS
jgi:hypothetical protein